MHRPKNLQIKALATTALVMLALLGACRAEAAEMSTSTLVSGNNPAVIYTCLFTNLGTKPLSNVTVMLTDGLDEVHNTFGVPPGSTQGVNTEGTFSNSLRCVASGKFTKSNARLNMQIVEGSTGTTRAAVEGR